MNKRLSSLKSDIGRLFDASDSVCLWFSGGSDSRLLLEVMLEGGHAFGILRFDDGWNTKQRRSLDQLLIKKNIPVLSYPPTMKMLIGDGSELSLICGYSVDDRGSTAMLVRDLVDDGPCAFDIDIPLAPQVAAPVEYKIHVWGTRFDDRHYSVGKVLKSVDWAVGSKMFVAPLHDWKREDVRSCLADYDALDLPDIDTGDIHACTNCLKGSGPVFCPKVGTEIDSVDWSPKENLQMFRDAIGAK